MNGLLFNMLYVRTMRLALDSIDSQWGAEARESLNSEQLTFELVQS